LDSETRERFNKWKNKFEEHFKDVCIQRECYRIDVKKISTEKGSCLLISDFTSIKNLISDLIIIVIVNINDNLNKKTNKEDNDFENQESDSLYIDNFLKYKTSVIDDDNSSTKAFDNE